MNNVGPKGKGESVWLGFFLYNVLDRFTKIMEQIKEDLLEKEVENQNENNEDSNRQCWQRFLYKLLEH